ncbi:MAG: hypothetical protein EOP87_19940, partial [Verrucomicrobiaceae bacterium]
MACPVLLAHGAYHDVVAKLEAGLASTPDDPLLHYRLAEAHMGHGEWVLCLDEVETIEGLAPGEHDTAYLRGWAMHTAGKQEEAKRILDDFLSANPDHAPALAVRGRVEMKLADTAAAA